MRGKLGAAENWLRAGARGRGQGAHCRVATGRGSGAWNAISTVADAGAGGHESGRQQQPGPWLYVW